MNPTQSLRHLARLHGIQTDYFQVGGRHCKASPEILLAVLRALGSPVDKMEDVAAALRQERLLAWNRVVPPVLVFWDREPAQIRLRLPEKMIDEAIEYEIELEEGGATTGRLDRLRPIAGGREIEGGRYVSVRAPLHSPLPYGYHRLGLKAGARYFESLIIAAPRSAYDRPKEEGKLWGLFLPLYALHTGRSWGAGDFSDLRLLMEWTRRQGGSTVATLPLVATLPSDPSPYAPVSRLFWNEFYLDPAQVPGLSACPSAAALLGSREFQSELELLRSAPLVDYPRQMSLKRRALEALASCFFRKRPRSAEFKRFVAARPEVDDYAAFRAVEESRRRPWWEWPSSIRDGRVDAGDYRPENKQYHMHAQWLLHEQMTQMASTKRQGGTGLFLDLPLGVSRNSYDVWRHRSSFALDMSGGAPPDDFFTKGQNWGFPPPHPERIRETRHAYFIDCVRHHLAYAGMLRIDHVMGLHRLFWIPRGAGAADGVYVRYPSEDLYAILCLESRRSQSVIVGENLGTVPPYVNTSMARHGIYGMYVGQFHIDPFNQSIAPAPQDSIAGLNTHDTPPFAAFWNGLDIEDRIGLGLLDEEGAQRERERRNSVRQALLSYLSRTGYLKTGEADIEGVLRAFLDYLASSPARLVLVNLEDLWLEERPQNVPGTWNERPNWRRKTRHPFEHYCKEQNILYTLDRIHRLRRQANGTIAGKP